MLLARNLALPKQFRSGNTSNIVLFALLSWIRASLVPDLRSEKEVEKVLNFSRFLLIYIYRHSPSLIGYSTTITSLSYPYYRYYSIIIIAIRVWPFFFFAGTYYGFYPLPGLTEYTIA